MTYFKPSAEAQSRRALLSGACALTALALLPQPALAHRERFTLTEIEWEDNPGVLYVTHSFHIHEAERALYKAGVLSKPDLYSLKTRAQLALYAEKNFSLEDSQRGPIDLQLLGAEISGGNCFVYQEAYLDEKPTGLAIAIDFMRSLDSAQINHVDVKLGTNVQSTIFRSGDLRRMIDIIP